MLCENCSREMRKNWEYCPFCGKSKSAFQNLDNVSNIMKQQFKMFDNLVSGHKINFKPINIGDSKGFKITIGTNQIPKMSYEKKEPKKRRFQFFKKFRREEAKGSLKRLGSGLRYEIKVPGIKSIDDVDVIKMGGSIEVKCYVKGKEYFKLIPLDLGIKRHYLEKDKLIIELIE